jgi:transcriptional regulator with XRE-family HTH domain
MATIIAIMARRSSLPMPAVERLIVEVGQNIRLARQRRQLSAQLVAERAGMSRPTLRAIERGDPGVTFGAVANVLHSLGLAQDLAAIARDDELGRKLEDAQLETKQRVRRPKPRAPK